MAETVRVEYVLSDRISRKLEKIQRAAGATELKLRAIDERLKKMSKSNDAQKFGEKWEKQFKRFDKAASNSQRKMQGMTRTMDSFKRANERASKSMDNTTQSINAQHSAMKDLGASTRSARDASRGLRDTNKSLERHMTTNTRVIEQQRKAMLNLSNETASAANNMMALRDAERDTHSWMKKKNNEAYRQRKHLGALGTQMNRTERSARGLNRKLKNMGDVLRDVQDYSFFEDGFKNGAELFQVFTKLLGIVPVLATGLGGIGNTINAISTGVVTLTASLGRLAGGLGALGGIYASIGIAGAVGKGTIDQLFKPMVKNGKTIDNLNRQISAAQRTLSDQKATAARAQQTHSNAVATAAMGMQHAQNAQGRGATKNQAALLERVDKATLHYTQTLGKQVATSSAAANNEDRINQMVKERNQLMQLTNARYQEFNSALQTVKVNFSTLMSGDANKNIDFALATFQVLNGVMDQMANSVKEVQGAIRGLLARGLGIISDPSNMKVMQASFHESAVSVNIIGSILEKVAPLFLRMVVASQRFANRLLKSLDAWLEIKEANGDIAKWGEKIYKYYGRSEASIHRWVNILKNVGGAFVNIFKAAAPTTARFEEDLQSVTENFKNWTGKKGNFERMQVFFGQTYRTLKALGRLGVSILTMFGEMSGGGSPSKSIKVADSMVAFLDTLGSGLERFGRYSADSLVTVGPALTRFFKALGGLAATANLNGTITNVIDVITKLIEMMNGFTKATGTGDILNFMLKMRIYTYTLGIVMGNILGPFSRFLSMMQGMGSLLGKGGAMAGGLGGKLGKAGRALSIATAQPVFVTNWPVGMGMGGGPGTIPVDGPGGRKGGRGGGWFGGRGGPGATRGMRGLTGRMATAYWGARIGGAGRVGAFAAPAKTATRAMSAGGATMAGGLKGGLARGGVRALPVLGAGLVAVDAVNIMRNDKMSAGDKSQAMGTVAAGGLGAWGGASAGAAVGGAIGAGFGGVGAAPGALIGGVVGGTAGYLGGTKVGQWGGGKVADAAAWMTGGETSGDIAKMEKAGNFYEAQGNAYRAISTGKGNIYKTEKQQAAQLLQTLNLKTQEGRIGAQMVTEALNMNEYDAQQLIAAERSRQISGDIMKATLAMEKNRKMTDKAKEKMRKQLGLTKTEMQKAENKVAIRKGHREQVKSDNKYGIQRIGGKAYQTQADADRQKAAALAGMQKSGKSSSQSNYLYMKHQQIARMQGGGTTIATKGEIQTARATEQAKGLAGVQQANALGEQYQPMIDKLNTLRDQIKAVDPNNPDNEFFQNMDGASAKIGELMPEINTELETQYGTLTTTINEQNGLLASQISTTGGAIVDNTQTWVSGVNTALGGLVNPVATGAEIPTNALGGFVPKFAKGGVIMGDPRKGDVVPLMAAGGEVILNEQQQQAVGKGRIHSALRGGTTPHHKSFDGSGRPKKYAEGGEVTENPFKKIESMFGLRRSSGDHDGAGVHASGSYHYRQAPWGGVQAYDYGDASNSAASLQAAAAYANQNASMFAEEFFDKYPSYVKNGNIVKGQFGGHGDHVHLAIAASGAFPGSSGITGFSPAALPKTPDFGPTNMGTRTTAVVNEARNALKANQQALGSATVGAGAGQAKAYAQSILSNYGWGPDQFDPLDKLWTRESGWRVNADNPTSDAYGIPQALPGSKMASAGDDWMTNPATQIRWGLGYIKGRYGNPAAAWQHSEATNWYKNGGSLRVNKPTMIGVGEGAGPEDVQIKPLQGSSGRARNGSGRSGGAGHNFTTNISVGMMIGDESGLEQLTDMIGNRMAEDLRRARGATMEDDLDF